MVHDHVLEKDAAEVASPGAAQFVVGAADEITGWRYGSERIDFANLSVGYSGSIENYSEEDLREHFAPALAAIAQEGSEDKVVFVWAAGNSNGLACEAPISQCVDGEVAASSVELLPGLAMRIAELREHTVGVVAVRPDDGLIADFSNRCGIAADSCLAAPGQGVRVAYFGPEGDGSPGFRAVGTVGGTSVAAPMVTGGLALMKQYFRSQLTNPDLLARLLDAADPESDREMPDELLVDNVVSFLVAGYDTTALAMTWTLFLISQSPEWEARILDEVETVAGPGPVGSEHVADLQVVQQVVKEALRLYPTAPVVARDIDNDIELDGTNAEVIHPNCVASPSSRWRTSSGSSENAGTSRRLTAAEMAMSVR